MSQTSSFPDLHDFASVNDSHALESTVAQLITTQTPFGVILLETPLLRLASTESVIAMAKYYRDFGGNLMRTNIAQAFGVRSVFVHNVEAVGFTNRIVKPTFPLHVLESLPGLRAHEDASIHLLPVSAEILNIRNAEVHQTAHLMEQLSNSECFDLTAATELVSSLIALQNGDGYIEVVSNELKNQRALPAVVMTLFTYEMLCHLGQQLYGVSRIGEVVGKYVDLVRILPFVHSNSPA